MVLLADAAGGEHGDRVRIDPVRVDDFDDHAGSLFATSSAPDVVPFDLVMADDGVGEEDG